MGTFSGKGGLLIALLTNNDGGDFQSSGRAQDVHAAARLPTPAVGVNLQGKINAGFYCKLHYF